MAIVCVGRDLAFFGDLAESVGAAYAMPVADAWTRWICHEWSALGREFLNGLRCPGALDEGQLH